MPETPTQADLARASRWRSLIAASSRFRPQFHRDLQDGEKTFFAAMAAFILAAGAILYIVTPVPFLSLARGMSLYLMLPFVSVSIVWVMVRLAEKLAGHRFAFAHPRAQWMVVTALATSSAIPIYGLFKQFVLKAQGFPLDPLLARLDRLLFFGYDAWEVMHALFGSLWATILLDRAYSIWLPLLMFCPVLWAAVIGDPLVRGRLIGCWLAVWALVGGVAAWLLASAGPMYYPHFIGPHQSFQALHDRVIQLGELARESGNLITTPIGHMVLMKRYESGIYFPGFGISAMPSVHVSMAALFAIGGFAVHRWLGWMFTAYAIVIWIGSIYLGWHYALDGIIGAALTYGIWKLSAKLAEPFEPRPDDL